MYEATYFNTYSEAKFCIDDVELNHATIEKIEDE